MFRDGVARLLVFRLGAERFGIDLASVDEVVDAPAPRPMPDAAPTVAGVASVRGTLVAMYDPRPVLSVGRDVGAGDADGAGAVVGVALLFTRTGRRLGLVVDDVAEAMTIDEGELLAIAGTDDGDGVLHGVVRRGATLIAVLDADALLRAVVAQAAGVAVDDGERG